MTVDYCYSSSQGDRPYNEDRIAVVDAGGKEKCFLLADGLGGHGMGDMAAETAVNAASAVFGQAGCSGTERVEACFEQAQQQVLLQQKQQHAQEKMKTTMVLLTMEKRKAFYGHIGDSRIYHFHRKKIERLTLDHSVPQMLVAAGELQEHEIRYHPDRNRLLRAIGEEQSGQKFTLGRKPIRCGAGSGFLLCSDGFWEHITEDLMLEAFLATENSRQWLEQMQAIVEQNGHGKNMDNFSAITIKIK